MTTANLSQVLYRKWRPSTFRALAGQEHISTTLRNAVIQDRIAQTYLFCGTRGSGKTSTARILAKAINCLDPDNGDPCDQCHICTTINDGRNLDIIELDAASNRGVEEVREIRDRVNFQPAMNRRKVYIIDEAHMLTREASNAILKTLEEPPEHVVFILCTTEADRLLPTILSRCQRYDFRKLPGESITERLAYICEQESINLDEEAARAIARYANGSMRDALTMLDQIAIEHQNLITALHVDDSLGIVRSDAFLNLATQLIHQDATGSLETINTFGWHGGDRAHLHRYTLDLLRTALLISWDAAQSSELHPDTISAIEKITTGVDSKQIHATIQIWAAASGAFRYDTPSMLPLELAASEICHWQPTLDQPAPAPQPAAPPANRSNNRSPQRPVRQPAQATPQQPAKPAQPPAPPASPPTPAQASQPDAADHPEPTPPAPQQNIQPPRRQQPPRPERGNSKPQATPPRRPRTPRPPPPTDSRPPEGADDVQTKFHEVILKMVPHKGDHYNLGALLRDCRILNVRIEQDTLVIPFTNFSNMERMQQELANPEHEAKLTNAIKQAFSRAYPYRIDLDEQAYIIRQDQVQEHHLVKAAIGLGGKVLNITPPA